MEATRGPLCILAGAGTGKTTTITRRIAWQVASGAFPPGQIVAVTFTGKAAGELRARLRALGTDGVAPRPSTRRHSRCYAISKGIRAGSFPRRRRCCGGSAIRCRGRSASGPPATLRRRSSGPRTGASHPTRTTTGSATTSRRSRPTSRSGCSGSTSGARPPRGCSTSRTCSSGRRGCSKGTRACARRFTTAGALSPSTSTRTSTCSSSRCSTSGSATGTISARSATTTRRSTASRARAPSGCSRCRAASPTLTSCGSSGATARPRR